MPDRLQEIRDRLDAATAKWSHHSVTEIPAYREPRNQRAVDRLIAHAPADIAWLLSENEALREQIGFLHEDAGESRLVVKSPQERVWEVWRTTRDRKVATFRTKREATAYVEGGGDE